MRIIKRLVKTGCSLSYVFLCGVLSVPAQQDASASLSIRFANGASQFHVGEIIPVELAFSASAAKTFEINNRSYDRSGRLGIDQFQVTPAGRDPLHNYYFGGVNKFFMAGGLFNVESLNNEPRLMTEELNEWVALEKPGHYSLYVTSSRVSRSGQSMAESMTNPVKMESNTLEFDVVEADPVWQHRTLAAVLAVLDGPDSTKEEKRSALRTLRFLDSPASIRVLAQRMAKPGDGDWDCEAGLLGSRSQQLVLQELESQLAAPDTAITAGYLSLLGQTRFMLEHSPMPPWPWGNKEQEKAWEELDTARTKEFDALEDSLYEKTASVLSLKRGIARAETVQTLLLRPVNKGAATKPLAGLRESEVESALLALPEEEQANMLEHFWPHLKTAGMTSVLERILDQPEITHHMLRGLALRRLNELDPEKAAARVLEEIRRPHADLGVRNNLEEVMEILPDKPLPQFDQLLATRLADNNSSNSDLDSRLIARYATKAILPRVKAVYEMSGDRDCEDGLVSYFLRVDVEYGLRRLQEANLACMKQSLKVVARAGRWNDVEPSVIAKLNGPDLWAARNAAEVLAQYGGAGAKKAMWARLRSFHKQWAKREKEFQSTPDTPRDLDNAMSFQYGLVEAMGSAQGWLLDDSEITELEHLILGQQKNNVASWHWHSPLELDINFWPDEKPTISIGHYFVNDIASLTKKLAQFPPGTHFRVAALDSSEHNKQLEPIMRAIHESALEHAFTVDGAATD